LPEALPCPGFQGGKKPDSAAIIVKGDDMARRGYPPEFRRRVVELVGGGGKVAEVAADLGIGGQTVYT
jgi:transposase-like protein